ncbi:MAG TPA: branched-chain amino acid ABC transporter permease [Stellaceae bacterium]|nr:branched-chain amino acid ABC transporter permease [Stellaceae bacterium]
MDQSILLILTQDGVTNGAVYALLALALVLVFAVTRVILIPQGEFVSYGALTLAGLELGQPPVVAWLLVGLGVIAAVLDLAQAGRSLTARAMLRILGLYIVGPLVLLALGRWLAPMKLGLAAEVLITLVLVTPLGPLIYRIAYQPLAEAAVLVLLIASVGIHFALMGLGLIFFGAEGSRTTAFSDARMDMGILTITGQSLWVLATSLGFMVALYLFFEHTLWGKALRATAVNRLGARLVGISTALSGRMAFTVAAFIGALSGILIAPLTTIYYDSGFLIGLKGFVAAIIGGLGSYPAAVLAALLVGLIEAFSSFWASAYKEVIVFTVIIPVLLWRSLAAVAVDDEE